MNPFSSDSLEINAGGKDDIPLLELVRSKDWSDTPIGAREKWPRSLEVALDIILHSAYPMFVWWGPELTMFYNQAYIPVLGQKHPDALGESSRKVWSDIWSLFAEKVEDVLQGQEFHIRDMLVYLNRRGYTEEAYWTFSLSPVLNDQGKIGGIFGVCNEESSKIQQERRHNNIRDLSALAFQYKDLPSLGKAVIGVLMENSRDIPCAALYVDQPESIDYTRLSSCDGPHKEKIFPEILELAGNDNPYRSVIREMHERKKLATANSFQEVLLGLKTELGEPVDAIAAVPLLKPGQEGIIGVLVCGLSPHIKLDEAYTNYLNLAAAQISAGITDARSFATDRQTEQTLKESEKRFRELADNVPIIIWATDVDGNCTYTNKPWMEYSGQSFAASKGQGWLEKVHPEDIERVTQIFLEANRKQESFSFNYRVMDRHGNYFWHVDSGLPKYGQNGEFSGFIGVIYNVHERKLAEEQLQDQEEKLRLAVEATNLGTWDYYPLKGLLQWSDTCKEIFGIPIEEKMSYEKFLDALHEEDRERTDQKVQAALEGKEYYDIEYRVIRKTDGEERWIRATGKAYFNELEEAFRFIGTALDITDRKLAEEQKNDFLRMAGHELRTPLTSIVGYLGLLQRMISEQDKARPFLDKSLQSTLKMRGLISDFLDISKVERGELSFNMGKVNLSQVIQETINGINIEPTQHPLELHIERDLYIYGDEERLEQVVLNLLNNAQKYSPKGQTINIDLRSGKEKVLLRIKDKGVGMHQKEVERIFQKFYRGGSGTRAKGMGLGLYIVKKIIDYHNGEIRVQTVPEKGSQFTVEFPAFQNK